MVNEKSLHEIRNFIHNQLTKFVNGNQKQVTVIQNELTLFELWFPRNTEQWTGRPHQKSIVIQMFYVPTQQNSSQAQQNSSKAEESVKGHMKQENYSQFYQRSTCPWGYKDLRWSQPWTFHSKKFLILKTYFQEKYIILFSISMPPPPKKSALLYIMNTFRQ